MKPKEVVEEHIGNELKEALITQHSEKELLSVHSRNLVDPSGTNRGRAIIYEKHPTRKARTSTQLQKTSFQIKENLKDLGRGFMVGFTTLGK